MNLKFKFKSLINDFMMLLNHPLSQSTPRRDVRETFQTFTNKQMSCLCHDEIKNLKYLI